MISDSAIQFAIKNVSIHANFWKCSYMTTGILCYIPTNHEEITLLVLENLVYIRPQPQLLPDLCCVVELPGH